MADQLVPVSSAPNQQVTVILNINNQQVTLNLLVYWSIQGFWLMNIADRFNNPLLSSVPLVTGVWPGGNLLGPYGYLGIGSAFIIQQNGAVGDFPNVTNLGSQVSLLWSDN